MYEKTPAIVLHLTRHTDKTSIVHLYTRSHGRINCAVNNLHGRKSNTRSALFMPLSLLHIEANMQHALPRIKEAQILFPYPSTASDPIKRSIALFMAEVLYRSLQQPEADEALFDYIYTSIASLEGEAVTANFHLHFLIQLSAYLGFYPNIEETGAYFDLQNGVCCTTLPLHAHVMTPNQTELFKQLCTGNETARMSRSDRQQLLEKLLLYFHLQLLPSGRYARQAS